MTTTRLSAHRLPNPQNGEQHLPPHDGPDDGPDDGLDAKLGALRCLIAGMDRVVVAFSGGADSALLAYVANDVLGPSRALAVTAVSASLASGEREGCESLAASWGLNWLEVPTDEMEDAAYRANGPDRCFYCKDALMDALEPLARSMGAAALLGVNVDDLGDHRPGQRAAGERGARFPLVEVGIAKDEVRAISRRLGLATWDKPAAACLASRLPYGTPVSVQVLSTVEKAECRLHEIGFEAVRVRHYGDTARLELPLGDLGRVLEQRVEVVEALKEAGYRYVTLDLEGLRSGNLNQALRLGG